MMNSQKVWHCCSAQYKVGQPPKQVRSEEQNCQFSLLVVHQSQACQTTLSVHAPKDLTTVPSPLPTLTLQKNANTQSLHPRKLCVCFPAGGGNEMPTKRIWSSEMLSSSSWYFAENGVTCRRWCACQMKGIRSKRDRWNKAVTPTVGQSSRNPQPLGPLGCGKESTAPPAVSPSPRARACVHVRSTSIHLSPKVVDLFIPSIPRRYHRSLWGKITMCLVPATGSAIHPSSYESL